MNIESMPLDNAQHVRRNVTRVQPPPEYKQLSISPVRIKPDSQGSNNTFSTVHNLLKGYENDHSPKQTAHRKVVTELHQPYVTEEDSRSIRRSNQTLKSYISEANKKKHLAVLPPSTPHTVIEREDYP